MLIISGPDSAKRVPTAIGTAVAPAPVALNTPSIRKENTGKDISVNLVPVGVSSVWGQTEADAKKEESSAEQQQLAQQQAQVAPAPAPSVAPWAKKDGSATGGESPPAPQPTRARNWADINDEEESSRLSVDDGHYYREVSLWRPLPNPFSSLLPLTLPLFSFPFSPSPHRSPAGAAQRATRASSHSSSNNNNKAA